MPIYEYVCLDCDNRFDRLWPTATSAQEHPTCPACFGDSTKRTISQVAVLGGSGGRTPQEESASSAESARAASYTPKEQIDTLQANSRRKRGQGR